MTIVAASIPIIWIFVRRANIKVPYSNDGIEVCEAQQTEPGELDATAVSSHARYAVTVQMNQANEVDATHTSRAPQPLAELAQPTPVESSQDLQLSDSDVKNVHPHIMNTSEMAQIQQSRSLLPELPGPHVTAPAELPSESTTMALGLQQSQQHSLAFSSPSAATTGPDVTELLRSQAQLQEKRRRLLELQQIDEQEEAIRRQLLEIHSRQTR